MFIKNKRNKGITLIALVVTIIVLLILAGISIQMLVGEGGILTNARDASESTKDANEEEEVNLAIQNALSKGMGELTTINLKEAIGEEFGADKKNNLEGKGPWTFTGERNTYTIETNGKIEKLGKSDISVSLTIKGTKVEEKDIPIPTGFVHVGGSINEGYVISDDPADKDKDVDSDDLKGNQFVWVPVDKDQKITAKVESKEDITSIVVTDPSGDNIKEENNVGKSYNEEIDPTINGEYKIKVTTSKGETSKTLEVYSLYEQNFWVIDELLLKQIKSIAEALGKTLEDYLNSSVMSLEEFLAMYKSECKPMYTMYKDPADNYKTNVNNNGGFYIGRYEAGDSSASQNRTSETDGKLVTQKNKYVYNYITQTEALTKAEEYAKSVGTNATSSLLTGAAWDRTLGWLYETGNKTIEEIGFDSTSWGNYRDDTFSNTTGLIKTGQFQNTKANNIYDLAGNVEEWTTETCIEDVVEPCLRGGYYDENGSTGLGIFGANERGGAAYSETDEGFGFRLALYL